MQVSENETAGTRASEIAQGKTTVKRFSKDYIDFFLYYRDPFKMRWGKAETAIIFL